METMLSRLTGIEIALTQANIFEDVVDVRNSADAMHRYLKRARKALIYQNRVAAVRLLAEKRAGEMLNELVPAIGGRPPRNRALGAQFPPYRLEDLGISRYESKQFRKVADVSEEILMQYIAQAQAEPKEITRLGLFEYAKKKLQAEAKTSAAAEPPKTEPASDHAGRQADYLYQDENITLCCGGAKAPIVIVADNSLTLLVTNEDDITRYYIIEAAPRLSLKVEEN